MATTKTRINITVPQDVEAALNKLASQASVSLSKKALDLIVRAIEIEEDIQLDALASSRDKKKTKWVSHDLAWK